MKIGLAKDFDRYVRLGKATIVWGQCDVCGHKYGNINGTWMPLCAHMDALYQCMKQTSLHSPSPICSPEETEEIKIGTKFVIKKAFFVETPYETAGYTQDPAMIINAKTVAHINAAYVRDDIIGWFTTNDKKGFAVWRNGVVVAIALTSEQSNKYTTSSSPNISHNSFIINRL